MYLDVPVPGPVVLWFDPKKTTPFHSISSLRRLLSASGTSKKHHEELPLAGTQASGEAAGDSSGSKARGTGRSSSTHFWREEV